MTTWSPNWNNYDSQVGWCGPEQWVWAETADSGLYFVTALTSRSWISLSVSVCPVYYYHLISDYHYPCDNLQGVNKMAKEEEAYKWSTEDMWFSQIVELHIWFASILSKSAASDSLSKEKKPLQICRNDQHASCVKNINEDEHQASESAAAPHSKIFLCRPTDCRENSGDDTIEISSV